MPGLTQAMILKHSFQIFPMANPAWCVLVLWESWFPSVFSWQLRRAVTAEDITGQLGQPRLEVCVSVVDLPGTEAECWLFQPTSGSAAPVHGHQAWAFPHLRGIPVIDGGSTAGPCTQTSAPTAWLCRHAGLGCKDSFSSSCGLIRVLQHCPVEEEGTLENME